MAACARYFSFAGETLIEEEARPEFDRVPLPRGPVGRVMHHGRRPRSVRQDGLDLAVGESGLAGNAFVRCADPRQHHTRCDASGIGDAGCGAFRSVRVGDHDLYTLGFTAGYEPPRRLVVMLPKIQPRRVRFT